MAVTNNLFFLLATWAIFFVSALGIGRRVISRIKKTDELTTIDRVAALLVGYAVISLITYLLAAVHLLYQPAIFFTGAVIFVVGIWPGIRTIFELLGSASRTTAYILNPKRAGWFTTLVAVIAIIIIFMLMAQGFRGTFLPDKGFDALWYHLTEAKLYLQEHHLLFFAPPAQLAQSTVAPRLMEFLYSFTLAFSPWGDWAKWSEVSLILAVIPAVYVAGRQLGKQAVTGIVAVLFTLTLPVVIWLMTTAYVDLATLAGMAVFMAYLVEIFGDKTNNSKIKSIPVFYLALLALVGGFLLATKLWNLIYIPSLIIFVIFLPKSTRPTWREFAWMIGGALLVASPFYLESLIRTGNPIYPVLNPQFQDAAHLRGALTLKEYLTSVLPNTTLATWTQLLVSESLLWIGLILIGANLITKSLNRKQILPFIMFALVLFLLWSIIPVADMRYALIAVPALAVVGATGIGATFRKVGIFRLFVLATIVLSSLNLYAAIRVEERQYVGHPITNTERAAYVEHKVGQDTWGVFDESNVLPDLTHHEKVLLLGHNMFYVDVPFTDGLGIASNSLPAETPDQLLNQFHSHNYHYLLIKINTYAVKDLFLDVTTPSNDWISEHFNQIWSDPTNNLVLYAIN